ncbi:MAG: glycoside hydrolase family 30 beta sandwich domain-containing protein [Ferruginibacter sp.]
MNKFFFLLLISLASCSKKNTGTTNPNNPNVPTTDIESWLTTADRSSLLQKQTSSLIFTNEVNGNVMVEVDPAQTYQSIDGFGYTLTGGSAYHLNRLPEADKSALLAELFGASTNSIGISYLRISLGASDLDAEVFSYNDMPAGQTDINLANFSLSKDTLNLIPVLKKIIAINPNIKLLASPWSPPVWMKDNGSSIGGSLQSQFYNVYAKYFVKYIQAMAAQGITIDAITIQNEPFHPGNNPSMYMTALQQADFIKNHLGPAFAAAGLQTKIILWDHNCNHPEYPITILNDAAAKQYVNGSAFHLYEGDVSAMSTVHNAHPDRALYFTEQWTGANGSFDGDLKWHIKNVIVGTMRNWSRIALEWNLASDPNWLPHTPGGCTECKGALTISGSSVTRNVSYYIIAHVSKFVPPGSVRIGSSAVANFSNVAFLTPSGKKVLVVLNEAATPGSFNIKYNGRWVAASLAPGAVATYVW